MSTLDSPLYSERCTQCKRPLRCPDPLDECWCSPGKSSELVATAYEQERVRNQLRDGSPGPIRMPDRAKARDGL